MMIESNEPSFRPLKIVIESQKELGLLWHYLSMGGRQNWIDYQSENYINDKGFIDDLWGCLNAHIEKYDYKIGDTNG